MINKDQKRNLGEIFEHVLRDSETKQDQTFTLKDLNMGNDGRIILPELGSFLLNDWSTAQLAQKIGIPVKYIKNCPPDLQALNFNYWLQNSEDANKEYNFRLRRDSSISLIRGVMTSRYSPFDDHEILEILNRIFTKHMGNTDVEWFYRDETGFHLRILVNELQSTIGNTIDGRPDIHKVGLHITNSEVGKGSIRVSPLVWRLVCTNGLVSWKSAGEVFTQRHIGLDSEQMYVNIAAAVTESISDGINMIKNLVEAKKVTLSNPLATMRKYAESQQFSKKLTDTIEANFSIEPDNNVFGVVQAITRAAQLYEVDRRVELESLANTFLLKQVA
jgi:hypothetical protein